LSFAILSAPSSFSFSTVSLARKQQLTGLNQTKLFITVRLETETFKIGVEKNVLLLTCPNFNGSQSSAIKLGAAVNEMKTGYI
jgi:hypothetical protein